MRIRAQVSKSWRERNRRMGRCVGCTRRTSKGFALCGVCREARSKFQIERKKSGMCYRCVNKAATGRNKCLDCVLKTALYDLKRKGLPRTELDKAKLAFEAYNGWCDACGFPTPPGKERFDHDENTSKFRGIICHGCNVAIGFAEESIQKLQGCIRYLEKQQ